MEALLAVGLAGNVVQFVQFASKVVSEANEIRKRGQPSSVPRLKRFAGDLVAQAAVITDRLRACATALTQEEQILLDNAAEFGTEAKNFTTYLDTLVHEDRPKNLLRSAKESLKFRWNQHHIEDFLSRLENLRNALALATTLALRAHANGSHEELVMHLKQLQLKEDDHSQILLTIERLIDLIEGQNDQRLSSIQRQVEECVHHLQSTQAHNHQNAPTPTPGSQHTIDPKPKGIPRVPDDRMIEILDWLHFRQKSWRYDEVVEAFQDTYEWVFSAQEDNEWDDFSEFLRADEVALPYFINGKAGSGKSTLMKFVLNNQKTYDLLHQWSRQHRLLVLKNFFWNMGTSLQKSHTGMLRTLLHEILTVCPDLIPVTFPTLYETRQNMYGSEEPKYVELKKAFEIIRVSQSNIRICIFIDGIDELEGDHRDMARFIRSLASPHIKVVVSSRPILPCLLAFQDCPNLRLQDLTKEDIDTFARGQLTASSMMDVLVKQFPQRTEELVSCISSRAEGVFLWAQLVVRILIDGLEAGDDIQELENKLDKLPQGLENLYKKMLGKMSIEHQVQAAEIFQIYEKWLEVRDLAPSALYLSYAVQDPLNALKTATEKLQPQYIRWQLESFHARLRSRCCGLLELRGLTRMTIPNESQLSYSYTQLEELEYDRVVYLHRTVAEFIRNEDVWFQICTTTSPKFDSSTNLAAGCLTWMKAAIDFGDNSLRMHLKCALQFCRIATMSKEFLKQIIDEIDCTMNTIRARGSPDMAFDMHWSTDIHDRFEISRTRTYNVASIYSLAAMHGISQYVRCYPPTDEVCICMAVISTLHCWSDHQEPRNGRFAPDLAERTKTLEVLLQNVKPENCQLGFSLWSYAFDVAIRLDHNFRKQEEAAALLGVFIAGSTSAQELIRVQNRYAHKEIPEDMIERYARSTNPSIRKIGLEMRNTINSDAKRKRTHEENDDQEPAKRAKRYYKDLGISSES